MKNSKEITDTVLKRRNAYREKIICRNRKIKTFSAACSAMAMIGFSVLGIKYADSPKKDFTADNDAVTAETSTAETMIKTPDESESGNIITSIDKQTAPIEETREINDDSDITEIYTIPPKTDAKESSEAHVISEPSHTQTYPETAASDTVQPHITEPPKTTLASEIHTAGNANYTGESSEEIATEINNPSSAESMPVFILNDVKYSMTGRNIDKRYISDMFAEMPVLESDTSAEIYKIADISEKCFTAVRFKNSGNYYLYMNNNYFPETLGELIDNLDLENTVSFGDMYIDGNTVSGDIIKSLLLENRNCIRKGDSFSWHKGLLSFSTSIDILGISNKSTVLTEDGYISMNIMEWEYLFYIGEDKVKEVYDMVN